MRLPEIGRPSSQMRGGQGTPVGGAGPLQKLGAAIGAKVQAAQQQAPMNSDAFFKRWNESGNNDALKQELLDRLIQDNVLKLETVRRKPDLLSLLHQAFENNTPVVYERATIVVSDFVDSKWLQAPEISALNPVRKIARTLAPKKPTEDTNYAMGRQLSALNLLCKLDKWDIQWTAAYSEEISKVAGVDTVVHFVE